MSLARTVHDPVVALIREVSASVILPRFRSLGDHEIEEKAPGELVTIADREAEHRLAAGLTAILTEARVVGEEACSADPALLENLDRGFLWIVDPIDGTANFARGEEPFGTMVALACDGHVLAGWIYAPVAERLHFAFAGAGAFVQQGRAAPERLTVRSGPNRPVATIGTLYMEEDEATAFVDKAGAAFDLQPVPRCAAAHYPRLCEGDYQVALFRRTLPWDHSAGALLLTEAGGVVTRWDGSPYKFHEDSAGILAASSVAMWNSAKSLLLPGNSLVTD